MSSSLQSFDSNLNKTALIKQHKWPLKIHNAPVTSSASLHYMSISSCDICTASAINGKTDYVQGISGHAWFSNRGLTTHNQSMVASRPNKRRKLIFPQSPWHKLVLQGPNQECALATNKICKKIDDKVRPRETIHPSKRRLVLSTHLMQQLLQPPPVFVLSGNVRFNYEIVIYFVSRITLGDTCCLKSKITDQEQESFPLELIKAFKEKMQKLEINLQRLEKTTSMADIVTEIHDLERFSTLNHLAKFHSRTRVTNFFVHPSTSATTRSVVAITMPRNLPEPVHCLTL